jgi:hypothetical protein
VRRAARFSLAFGVAVALDGGMTRRRFLFLSLAAAVVALAIGVWLLWPRTAITRENAEKIRLGMTLAEVEAILGGPPGNYTGVFFKRDVSVPLTVEGSAGRQQWTDTRGVVIVFFDKQEKVMTSMYFPTP